MCLLYLRGSPVCLSSRQQSWSTDMDLKHLTTWEVVSQFVVKDPEVYILGSQVLKRVFYHSSFFLLFPPFPFLSSSPPSNSSLFFIFDKIFRIYIPVVECIFFDSSKVKTIQLQNLLQALTGQRMVKEMLRKCYGIILQFRHMISSKISP